MAPELAWRFWTRDSCFSGNRTLSLSADRILIGARFSIPVQTGPYGPPSLLYSEYRVSFPGMKRPSSAEIKEKVELYLYAPSGSSWPLPGRT